MKLKKSIIPFVSESGDQSQDKLLSSTPSVASVFGKTVTSPQERPADPDVIPIMSPICANDSINEDLTIRTIISYQVDMYLNMEPMSLPKDDPNAVNQWGPVALFYREHERKFPLIAELANKFLSTPVSSVYSERLFSEFGQVYEKKRSRLTPKNAEGLLMLHHNMERIGRYKNEEAEARSNLCRNKPIDYHKFENWEAPRNLAAEDADENANKLNDDDIIGIYSDEFRLECEYLN